MRPALVTRSADTSRISGPVTQTTSRELPRCTTFIFSTPTLRSRSIVSPRLRRATSTCRLRSSRSWTRTGSGSRRPRGSQCGRPAATLRFAPTPSCPARPPSSRSTTPPRTRGFATTRWSLATRIFATTRAGPSSATASPSGPSVSSTASRGRLSTTRSEKSSSCLQTWWSTWCTGGSWGSSTSLCRASCTRRRTSCRPRTASCPTSSTRPTRPSLPWTAASSSRPGTKRSRS
mmetsp:Transcript_21205/g.67750  ORF Transcript_21205/g.67750 Transcript_21205/m.67750 type:complete len:233 (-) Transcript_21205:1747-2445(-)